MNRGLTAEEASTSFRIYFDNLKEYIIRFSEELISDCNNTHDKEVAITFTYPDDIYATKNFMYYIADYCVRRGYLLTSRHKTNPKNTEQTFVSLDIYELD